MGGNLRWGTPPVRVPPLQPGLTRGRVTPHWGTPQPGLTGVPKVGSPPARFNGGTQGGIPPSGYPGQVWWEVLAVGYPLERSDGGVLKVGYPHWGTSLARFNRGYLGWGTPWQGYPRARPDWGTPPSPPGPGHGIPLWCGQTDGWMDGQTRVKTLPSRRPMYAVGNNVRTFVKF